MPVSAAYLKGLLSGALDWLDHPSAECCANCDEKARNFLGFVVHKKTCPRGNLLAKILKALDQEPEMGHNILAWERLEKRAEKAERGFELLREYLIEMRPRVSGIEAACIDMLLYQAEQPELPIVVGTLLEKK